ncbi:MAG TPA: glycosyltransferase family 2 protein [Solirubrobacteraceae bacterium]
MAPPQTGVDAAPRRGGHATAHPTISVVVPTYNRAHALEQVLAPLLADSAADEVIVVIDGSFDGSLEVVERIARTEPRLRALFIENSGEMAAREAGARSASSDLVLFVDDDVLAGPGLVTGHAHHHAGTGRAVVVGYMPVRVPLGRSAEDFSTRLYAREYEGRCEHWERDRTSVLRELWAGNFSMRREDCLALGLPNSRYTERYHPDRDFGIRCLEAGLGGLFDRSLPATHLHQRTLDAFVRDARSQGAARVLMPGLHPRTLPPPFRNEFERALPSPLRAAVRLARRRRVYEPLSSALIALVAGAGRAELWTLQDRAARLLRRIEQQRGAVDLAHGRR